MVHKKNPVEQNLADTLCIDTKASLLCYWQRLEQKSDNLLLKEAFIFFIFFLIGHAAWEI